MTRRHLLWLMGLWAGAAQAQDCALTGAVGIGAVSLEESSLDRAKLFEYRDTSGGLRSLIELTGCINAHTLKLEGENLGRNDERLNLQGRLQDADASGTFKYQLGRDSLRHNIAFDARTPYSGAGSAQQSATFPSLNPATWSRVDVSTRRRKDDGALEWSFSRAFYARLDASQIRTEGNKLQSAAQGTSPTHGFVDLIAPVDTRTRNVNLELGYHSAALATTLSYLTSRFDNATPLMSWSNGFFNGTDASPQAPSNVLERWSVNAVLRPMPLHSSLPLRSSLALRASTASTRSATDLLTSALSTSATYPTNPSEPTFRGRVRDDEAGLTLSTSLTRDIDTRLTFNTRRRDNSSSEILFTDLPSGLGCGQAPLTASTSSCLNERFTFRHRAQGVQLTWRAPQDNRVLLGYETGHAQRNRTDTTRSQDERLSVEWKNQRLENVSTRLKAQTLKRRADMPRATWGADATDPLYLQRFVTRYDVTSLDQTQLKFGVDVAAATHLDGGAEVTLKRNRYPDAVLGRTQDERSEVLLTLAWGDPRRLRMNAFVSWEWVRNQSTHRNINASTCPVIAPSLTPSPCFDPTQPATTTVYNWSATDRDRTQAAGLGVDWPLAERFVLRGAVLWMRAQGAVAVNAQALPSGASAADLVGINNWGNSEHVALTLKGDYRFSAQWSFTGGVSYEDMRFDDAQWNNATPLVPATGSGATTSYLSGVGAHPSYTAKLVFMMARYAF